MVIFDPKRNRIYDDGETPEEMRARKNRIRNIIRRQEREAEARAKEMAARPRCKCGCIVPRKGIRCMCGNMM